MWINHCSLWRMASATPDRRLPSQPQGITALDRYQIILLGDRGTCVWTTCPRLLAKSKTAVVSNPQHFELWVQCTNHYATRPQGVNMLYTRLGPSTVYRYIQTCWQSVIATAMHSGTTHRDSWQMMDGSECDMEIWRPEVERHTRAQPSCDMFNLGSSYFHVALTTVCHVLSSDQLQESWIIC